MHATKKMARPLVIPVVFLVVSHNSIRERVSPFVRRQTTYFVYTNLFFALGIEGGGNLGQWMGYIPPQKGDVMEQILKTYDLMVSRGLNTIEIEG